VLEKNSQNNTLIVGPKDQLGKDQLMAENVNWIAGLPPISPFTASIKIRYKAQDIPCLVNPVNGNKFQIKFENLVRDITPGQAAVLYNGDICLGGGIITNQTQ